MNLSVINYILPAHTDDLLISNIESYGAEFWYRVQAELIFKKQISDKLIAILEKYQISYSINPDGLWLPVVLDMVKNCSNDYVLIFFEDILILDPVNLIYAFENLEYNKLDFMPTYGFTQWNRIADALKNRDRANGDDEFTICQWGSNESRYFEKDEYRKEVTDGTSSPYPISLAGIFKSSLLIETMERQMKSTTWKNMMLDYDYYLREDWAKNPRLPHAYEVFWVHNKQTEIIEYTMLVPKTKLSVGNDPRDAERLKI